MRFCREIDKNNRIFYDSVKNMFYLNEVKPLPIHLTEMYEIEELVNAAEIAGMNNDEILYIVSSIPQRRLMQK